MKLSIACWMVKLDKFLLLILLLCLSSGISGQRTVVDTTASPATEAKKKSSFTSVFYGQPGKAALYGLILPGGGQFYNRRYWKIPLVWAAEGYTVYFLADKINSFNKIDRCWKSYVTDSTNPDIVACTLETGFVIEDVSDAFIRRDASRSAKEAAWLIMGAVHLMQLVEAFVDRHLINFDTNEDLSFHNLPDRHIAQPNLHLQTVNLFTFRIPLSGK